MSMEKIQQQVQAGLDARVAFQDEEDRITAAAGAIMLGADGTSVEEAARLAWRAGGRLSVEELVQMIRVRREHPSVPGRVAA